MSSLTTEKIPYDEAIRQVKVLMAEAEKIQWKLGQIADRIQPKYGDRTLETFAIDLGVNYKTLLHYQRVYRAYGAEISERPEISFSAAAALATHPDRRQLLLEKPTMTYREAEDVMAALRSEQEDESSEDDSHDEAEGDDQAHHEGQREVAGEGEAGGEGPRDVQG